jgi:cyclophilin family peptidyl-prolyl cis-trans isomerase
MRPFRVSALLGCTILVFSAAYAPGEQNARQQYVAARAEWDAVNGQLDALEDRFRNASGQEREEIRQRFSELVDQVNAMLPGLRQAAVAAYKEAPNEDPPLVRLLAGILANDVRKDRYDAAMEVARLLIDNGCPEKAVDAQAGMAAYCRDDFGPAQEYLTKAKQADVLPDEALVYLTDVAFAKKLWAKEQEIRRRESAADDLPRVLLKTTQGDILVELFENEAPQTVGNFVSLVEKGFYNGLAFHRVLPAFMAQAGCPRGDGAGGPGYEIYCECYDQNHRKHFRGSLSMAHAGRDTGGSQFFITFRRTSHLDGRHTVFGRVIDGLEVLPKLQRRDPDARGQKPEPDRIIAATVVRKRDHAYEPTKVQ